MKLALTTFGSEGDSRPFVALAQGLRRAGHDAYLVCAELHRGRAEEAGVPFRSCAQGWSREEVETSFKHVLGGLTPLHQGGRVFELAAKSLAEAAQATLEHLSDADAVIHHAIDVGGYVAALRLRKPRLPVHLFLGLLGSSRMSAAGLNLSAPLNRFSGALLQRALAGLTDGHFEKVWRAYGLAPRSGTLRGAAISEQGALLAVSPAVVPQDEQLAARGIVQTGFWQLEDEAYRPPPALAAFLESGPAPVVISFGSMVGMDVAAWTRMVVDAVLRAGQRAILQRGWAGLGGCALPESVLEVGHVPHSWLLPRARALVHHGGAGTTGAALRAGVPQVIVWHLGDQPAWGMRMFQEGVAPWPIAAPRATPSRLAEALRAACDPPRAQKAASLGERVRREDGVVAAVRAVEARFRPSPGNA